MQTPAIEGSTLHRKALGCLLGGLIGDAIGTPTEGKHYQAIEKQYGWVSDFEGGGTDDTVMKNLLCEALMRTQGYATLDDWAEVILDHWDAIFGSKMAKFFISVLHMAHKLRRHSVPRMAALGNMPSSSSAMCISPVGIVNACNPRQAALQTYNLASLIHVHDVGFCQDGAASMAAAVAEAMSPKATLDSVLRTATDVIIPRSGQEMRERIGAALALAREKNEFRAFREAVYRAEDRFFCPITCDSRETVPLTLAIVYLAGGNLEKCVVYGANIGRDADTIASMGGAICGALGGTEGICQDWVAKAQQVADVDQNALALKLAETALIKYQHERAAQCVFETTF